MMLQRSQHFDTPGTPDLSPASNDVHHHPTATAEGFVRRLFVNWRPGGAQKAEDAGVELVCPGWSGAVIERCTAGPAGAARDAARRALYVHMPRAFDRSQMRHHVLQVLDLASGRLCVSRVVFCLERDLPDLSSLLHGMCYVGGQVTSIAGQRDAWVEASPLASLALVTVPLAPAP